MFVRCLLLLKMQTRCNKTGELYWNNRLLEININLNFSFLFGQNVGLFREGILRKSVCNKFRFFLWEIEACGHQKQKFIDRYCMFGGEKEKNEEQKTKKKHNKPSKQHFPNTF